MSSCTQKFLLNLPMIIQNSAHYLNRKGRYYQCIQQQNMKYSLIEFGYGGADIQQFFSLCIPKSCPDSSLKKLINDQFIRLKLPFNVYNIFSSDNQNQQSMDWLSYFTIFLFAGLILLSLIGTIRSIIKKKSKYSLQEQKQKEKHSWLTAFDLIKNFNHFKIRQNEPLNIFDGVRALSMIWVVFGHTYLLSLVNSINGDLNQTIHHYFYLIVQGGFFAVDIFFMLSGFFLIFVLMRQKHHNLMIYGIGIIQRILRIWPAFILTMLFYYKIFIYTGSGPIWNKFNQLPVDLCSSMWRQIFFISNFLKADELCLSWSWYLQVDFQLFLLGIILFMIYKKKRVLFFIISYLCCIGSIVFVVLKADEIQVKIITKIQDFAQYGQYFDKIYIKPWGRCTAYIIGLIFGIIYMQNKSNKKNNQERAQTIFFKTTVWISKSKVKRLLMEWGGLIIICFIIFIPRLLQVGYIWPQIIHSLYYAVSKPIFLIGLFLVVLPTLIGFKKSFFNTILTSKFFHFISRISFCTYLVHLIVISQFLYRSVNDQYNNTFDVFVVFLGMLTLSLFFGFLTTMLIQLPFSVLQKNLIEYLKRLKAKKITPNQSLLSSQQIRSNQKANMI